MILKTFVNLESKNNKRYIKLEQQQKQSGRRMKNFIGSNNNIYCCGLHPRGSVILIAIVDIVSVLFKKMLKFLVYVIAYLNSGLISYFD